MLKYNSTSETYNFDTKPLHIEEYITDRIKASNKEIRIDWLIQIDDIVFNPIFNDIDEILSTLERIKSDYLKSLVLLRNITSTNSLISHTQVYNDYNFNKKLFSSSFSKIAIRMKFSISKVIIDLFSSFSKKTTPSLKDK
jgi:hypothetical protein